ncbi:MAG: hypothetical protein U0183_33515 [Polyangiaceae bacterium]
MLPEKVGRRRGGWVTLLVVLVACNRPPRGGSGAAGTAVLAPTDASAPSAEASATATTRAVSDGGTCLDLYGDAPGEQPEMDLVGRLYVDERARHAGNGVRLRPYILKLDRPLCVNGMLPQDDGTVDPYVPEIHVATMKRRPDLRPLKDTKVRVHGRPMGAMTAWHARPVVLWATEAERLTPAPAEPPPPPLGAGKHFGYIDAVDLAHKTLTFDVATLYRGKAAVLEAKKRESLLGVVGGDDASTFVVDEDPTRRTLPVASDVVVDVLVTSAGGATSRSRASLGFFDAKDAGDSEREPFERAWELTLKDGKVVRIDEVER